MTRTWRKCAQAVRKQSASRSLVFMWKCDCRLIPPGRRQRQARGSRDGKRVHARLAACIQSRQDERHGRRRYLNQERSAGRCERATLAFAFTEHTGNGVEHKDTLHTFSCACVHTFHKAGKGGRQAFKTKGNGLQKGWHIRIYGPCMSSDISHCSFNTPYVEGLCPPDGHRA